ncbi:TIGR01777 family oxidoreductase [Lipingzhangella sp. LS1_29]|uniref:TIGR01777 family oxidoreductase n=1 Tax=Lipingzhangella rawalii TaxID=2055835 RepID=A0ABU2H2G9_9ACTN|nr:TIGR01777 family oxidoreductase [Lipingzhangella rawalii]MDS1269503.1 TIGR01777 family oxidoreductase [Lipingzhangella rawalii]
MRIAMTGASGLIGSTLGSSLTADGHEVQRLVRRSARTSDEVAWDPGRGYVDTDSLAGADAVVHLAGAPIGPRRWTSAYKRQILESRTTGTRTLATALATMQTPVPRLLSASGISVYGDSGDRVVDEDSDRGRGFLPEVVRLWEASTAPAEDVGISVAHLRTAAVLSTAGGLLGTMLPLFRLGLGGRLGTGRQYLSWIALDDQVGAIRFLLHHPELRGPINLCSPEPVTNTEFTRSLAAALRRPAPFVVPAPALRAALGQCAEEMALTGQRARPSRLLAAGYSFLLPNLDCALSDILARQRTGVGWEA